jgi:hypothetical protein
VLDVARCHFPRVNYDEGSYTCGNEALSSGFCLFHDSTYHIENPDDVVKELSAKLKENVQDKMFCIGYHIPYIPGDRLSFTTKSTLNFVDLRVT